MAAIAAAMSAAVIVLSEESAANGTRTQPPQKIKHFGNVVNRATRERKHRKERIYRTRVNLFSMSSEQVLNAYRLDGQTIIDILEPMKDELEPKRTISTSLSPLLKFLAVLHFCATGSFQGTAAMAQGISQSAFSKLLHQVMEAFLKRINSYIIFPKSPEDLRRVKAGFYQVAGFPNVAAVIDCTHVRLVPPRAREHIYQNRNMQYSINVQMTCDSDLLITHCNANFPGSAEDEFILRSSGIPPTMEELNHERVWLLGDSAYPLKPWLLTPIPHPGTPAEHRYNDSHARTRKLIGQAFGLLKSRFRCLHNSGGDLLYAPDKVCRLIVLCCILHNIAVKRKIPMPTDVEMNVDNEAENVDPEDTIEEQNDSVTDGTQMRSDVVMNFFSG